MRIAPNFLTAFVLYIVYNLIIYATWFAVGADYLNMVAEGVVFKSIVLSLTLGFAFVMLAMRYTGWQQPILHEASPARPKMLLWIVVAVWMSVVILNMSLNNWAAMSFYHVSMLVLAGILVGFNEEAVTRGFLVVGLRSKTNSEFLVWFGSTLLFGLMHLPNAFFGPGLVAASIQVVFAFLAGSALYVVRRLSGSLMLPMFLHGIWDFSMFATQASNT
ncbi:MAG: CPBP family intramembrane metalloprotease, partial [Novosphingobium sp.]|nr:CPBP family intramembrane metalloprotease [Novosphingobium sp.]